MTPLYSLGQIETIDSPPIVETDDVCFMPASYAQQRYWILDQLNPGNTSLNMPLALRLNGRVDREVLERAISEVVTRHEILRTTISKIDGQVTQVIAGPRPVRMSFAELCERPDPEGEANEYILEEAHRPFDLARGPLFRAKLLRLRSDDHILLLTLHHAVCDGWSNGVLVRELGEIYSAFSRGLSSPLSELPIQYADFSAWEQDQINSDRYDDQLKYWRGQLEGGLPYLNIPTDGERSGQRSSFGAIESLLLPRSLTRAVKALGRRADGTPFMVFLSALYVLLHRYTLQEDILVGTPTANRSQTETEGLIGPFANTLLLRADLSGEPSFKEVIERVKAVSLGAMSNQGLPFEKLVDEIRPTSNGPNRGQLLQVLFIYQTAFMQPVELEGLSITPIRSASPGSIFELSLGVVERGEGIRLQLEYNTELFRSETIRNMLQGLRTILESAVIDPNRTPDDLLIWSSPIRTLEEKPSSNPPAGAQAEVAPSPRPDPREEIEGLLTNIWKEVLQVDSVKPTDDFFEVGGHSLLAAQLFDQIGKRLKVDLPLATLFTASTIDQLAEVIRQKKPDDVWTSLVPINSDGTRAPLFMMHAAGGNVLFYKDLAARLGSDQPFYGMQAVGLGGHQSAYDRIEDMAAHYIKEIRARQQAGPYYIGGSSIGGLIAFEVGSQLRRSGEEVALVVMFDTYAPGYPVYLPGRPKLLLKVLDLADRVQHHVETVWILERGERWNYLRSKAVKAKNQLRRAYKMTKRKVSRSVLAGLKLAAPTSLVETQNAIATAAHDYRPNMYDGDVLLFRATKQLRGIEKDDTLGWSKFASGNLEIHEMKGNHGTIVVEPRVRLAAEILKDRIDASRREDPKIGGMANGFHR